MNGFICTLGMTIVLAGLQNGIPKAQTLFALPRAFSYLGSAYWGQVPFSLVATAVIFVGVGLFLRYHRAGRAIYAVGGNAEAARAAGINVDRVKSRCTLPAAYWPPSAGSWRRDAFPPLPGSRVTRKGSFSRCSPPQ